MRLEIHRHPELGDPERARVACSACALYVYVDDAEAIAKGDPLVLADITVKSRCPRKARCRPWVDRGCRIALHHAVTPRAAP